MKNIFLGIAIANNILQAHPSLDGALDQCVSILCESQHMDGCYIYNHQINKISHSFTNREKTVKYSFDEQNLEHTFQKMFSKKHESFSEGKPIHHSSTEFEYAPLTELMNSRNIESFTLFPIISNKKLWGFIAFEKCEKTNCTIEETKSLHLLAKNIGIRIYKDSIIEFLGAQVENLHFSMSGNNRAMWEVDMITSIAVYSSDWAEMIGYSIDEIEQTYEFWAKNSHPEDLKVAEKNLHDYIANITSDHNGIMRMKHKKGHYIWIKYSCLLQRDRNGKAIKLIGTHIDITDLKEKEIELKISEEKYKFIAENTSDIICQHDREGRYIYISQSFKTILGYETSEMINKVGFDYIHPDDISYVLLVHKKNLRTDNHNPVTFRFRKKDNSYVWLEMTSKNILDNSNNAIGMQTCSRDVTERIQAAINTQANFDKEKELNQMKTDFVVMASHQFRTPLTVIYSNTELLEIKVEDLESETALLIGPITARIKNEVERMTELMNNVLVFAKYESQKLKKEVKRIDIDVFIETLIQTYFTNTSDGRKIQVTTKGKRKTISSDESLLVHILTNLITNAFKYSIGKANPSLNIYYLENEIQIEVIDYGIGVPEDEVKNLFHSFYRATNTSTIEGSGLGLSIVKQFTSFLNGTVELKTTENVGTTVNLKFPYE